MNQRFWIVANIVLGTIIFLTALLIINANQPYAQAKQEAIVLATEYADLKNSSDFYWYTRDNAVFSIMGTDKEKNDILVMIPQNGDQVIVYNQKDVLTEQEAFEITRQDQKPQKLLKATIGIFNKKNVWEVSYLNENDLLCYYAIDFRTGDPVNLVENI